MNILDELKNRKIFKDITNQEKFDKLKGTEGVYIGFDPTAKSLHLGNYVQMTIMKRFVEAGYKAIAVIGGATGMIGDPSGKSEERNLLDEDELNNNKKLIKAQLESFGFEVFDNLDIYKDMNVLEFMRDIGKLLNINYMTAKDVVASRLETGISFTEFSYQLIQGWDFKNLYDNKNVRIQIGGSDQWGNITSGIELIRKTNGDDNLAVGITTNLLTTASGKKFGKSEGNAIWLDKTLTSSYELLQYVISTPDEDVETLLNWLTYISVDDIKELMAKHNSDPSKRIAQNELAKALVTDIHGESEYKIAIKNTEILFGKVDLKDLNLSDAISLEGSIPAFNNINGNILDVLVETKLAQSRREAREFVLAGGVNVNGDIISDENYELSNNSFEGKANIIRRGKKKIVLIKY